LDTVIDEAQLTKLGISSRTNGVVAGAVGEEESVGLVDLHAEHALQGLGLDPEVELVADLEGRGAWRPLGGRTCVNCVVVWGGRGDEYHVGVGWASMRRQGGACSKRVKEVSQRLEMSTSEMSTSEMRFSYCTYLLLRGRREGGRKVGAVNIFRVCQRRWLTFFVQDAFLD